MNCTFPKLPYLIKLLMMVLMTYNRLVLNSYYRLWHLALRGALRSFRKIERYYIGTVHVQFLFDMLSDPLPMNLKFWTHSHAKAKFIFIGPFISTTFCNRRAGIKWSAKLLKLSLSLLLDLAPGVGAGSLVFDLALGAGLGSAELSVGGLAAFGNLLLLFDLWLSASWFSCHVLSWTRCFRLGSRPMKDCGTKQ